MKVRGLQRTSPTDALMSSSSLPTLAELTSELQSLDDWDDRYEYLVDLGRQLPPLPLDLQTEENRVRGCMSTVWLVAEFSPDAEHRIQVTADSDSLIVKGLIALLLSLYNGVPAAKVNLVDADSVFRELGLAQHLSPNRRNGLFAMVRRVRELATAASS